MPETLYFIVIIQSCAIMYLFKIYLSMSKIINQRLRDKSEVEDELNRANGITSSLGDPQQLNTMLNGFADMAGDFITKIAANKKTN